MLQTGFRRGCLPGGYFPLWRLSAAPETAGARSVEHRATPCLSPGTLPPRPRARLHGWLLSALHALQGFHSSDAGRVAVSATHSLPGNLGPLGRRDGRLRTHCPGKLPASPANFALVGVRTGPFSSLRRGGEDKIASQVAKPGGQARWEGGEARSPPLWLWALGSRPPPPALAGGDEGNG